jgi:hypothetical protein
VKCSISARSLPTIKKGRRLLLDPADESLLGGKFGELLVVLQELSSGFGDHDMVIALQGVLSDRVVSRIGSEDCKDRRVKHRDNACTRGRTY